MGRVLPRSDKGILDHVRPEPDPFNKQVRQVNLFWNQTFLVQPKTTNLCQIDDSCQIDSSCQELPPH